MLNVMRGVSRLLISHEQRAIRTARLLGLTSGEPCAETTARIRVADTAAGVITTQSFAAYRRLFEQEFERATSLPSGIRMYAAIADAIERIAPANERGIDRCEAACPVFERSWIDDGRSSFASAVYAKALFNTGFAWRGSEVASKVTAEAWDKHFEYTERAHDVLYASPATPTDCPLWHRIHFAIGISDGSSRHDLDDRFERACAFDPCDTTLYELRTVQLLPRWHGSFQELDVFATNAVTATAPRMGEIMYARIYARIADYEDLRDTIVDYDRLTAAYIDWLRETGSQYAANKLASAAFAFGDDRMIEALCRGHLRKLHLEHWSSPRAAADALAIGAATRRLAT